MQSACLALALFLQLPSTITGRVVDGRTGEPVRRAQVSVSETRQASVTGEDGGFTLPNEGAQSATVYVSAVGYALAKKVVTSRTPAGPIEIVLVPEGAALTEHITVTTSAFEGVDPSSVSEQSLSKSEMQALSMVLIGDALRSAQTLPGVAANNDLRTDFSVRGASFERIGVYVDGVLTDNFVHTFVGSDSTDQVSLSLINQDTVDHLSVLPGAFSPKYGDSTAAVTVLDTREANRVRPTGRFGTGLITTSGVVDGPFKGNRGGWLLSGRTSYVDYLQRLIQRITRTNNAGDDSQLTFSDATVNLNYDLSPFTNVGVSSISGTFGGNQGAKNRKANVDNPDSIDQFESRNFLLNAHWRYTPNQNFVGTLRGFLTRSKYHIENVDHRTLDDKDRTQFGLRSDLITQLSRAHRLEAGFYGRMMQAKKVSWSFRSAADELFERYDRQAVADSYYVQDTWNVEQLRFSLTGGTRFEHNTLTDEALWSPRLGATVALPGRIVLRGGLGVYRQLPDFDSLFGFFANPKLHSEKAAHYNFSVERLLGSRMRLVAEGYDREERGLLFSLSEPRIGSTGQITAAANPYRNSLNGHARGMEFTLQRRSANGLTGWTSYAYSRTRLRDDLSGLSFPSDADQRHTLNMFGSYRWTQTFSLSGQVRYGSGQPIPGFLKRVGSTFEFGSDRNQARLTSYSRMDVRASKSFTHPTWKWTLSGEVLNVLRHRNQYNVSSNLIRFRSTGQYFVSFDQSFRILPSVGVFFEF